MKLRSGYTIRDLQAELRDGHYVVGITDPSQQTTRIIGIHQRKRRDGSYYVQAVTMSGMTVTLINAYSVH